MVSDSHTGSLGHGEGALRATLFFILISHLIEPFLALVTPLGRSQNTGHWPVQPLSHLIVDPLCALPFIVPDPNGGPDGGQVLPSFQQRAPGDVTQKQGDHEGASIASLTAIIRHKAIVQHIPPHGGQLCQDGIIILWVPALVGREGWLLDHALVIKVADLIQVRVPSEHHIP